METGNQPAGTREREIIAGLKVIESEVRVQRPVFQDVEIMKPVFIERPVEIPVGLEKFIVELADSLADQIVGKCLLMIDQKLEKAIEARIKEVEAPRITYREEVNVVTKDVPVTNAVITDVPVKNAVLEDVIVKNPIIQDVPVLNAVLKDIEVEIPVYKDRIVINPKFEDVVIQKPKFVEKEIVVIHPKYIDMKGNPEPE